MILNYDCKTFIVEAAAHVVNYNRKLRSKLKHNLRSQNFIVQASVVYPRAHFGLTRT